MHKAIKQQTVSVAEAGLLTSFKTRVAVSAACNPKAVSIQYHQKSKLTHLVEVTHSMLAKIAVAR